MKLSYFTDREQLNNFVKNASSATSGAEFLQSWEWGELLKREGKEIFRVGVNNDTDGKILAAATIIKKSLGISSTGFPSGYFYWYAPRGPIGDTKAVKFLLREIKKIDSRALFFRIEPGRAVSDEIGADHSDSELTIKKTISLQPAKTLVLDLTLSEAELLSALHQKTRYNIRLAEKKGVEITAGTAADFPEFWRLMNLTGARDDFRLHDSRHYRNLIESAGAGNIIKLFFARYRERNVAAGLFCFFGDQVTYLHGASDNEFRNVMAPYLLQWFVIKTAKEAGYRYYDFCGIDEKKWPGVTRFKLGFGGHQIEYPGTFDVIFRPVAYNLYNFGRTTFRKLRIIIMSLRGACLPAGRRSDEAIP